MENNPNPENTEVTPQTPENASAIMDALSDEIDTPLGMPLHRETAANDMEKPENAATIMETLMERTDTPIGQAFPTDEELPVSQEVLPVLPQTKEPDVPAQIPEKKEAPIKKLLHTMNFGKLIHPDEKAMASHAMEDPVQKDMTVYGSDDTFRDDSFHETFDEDEFDAMFTELAQERDKKYPPKVRPARKGRPKHKKGYGLLGIPHLLATGVWLAIILFVGISLGRMLWVCAADVLAFGRESKVVTVTIEDTDTMEDIAQKLHEAGLVRYPGLFKLYADISGAEEKIITGSFELDTLYDYHALVLQMSPRSTNRGEIEVLIPEGYSCRQIFQLLEEKGVCKAAALEEYAANGDLTDYWFLEGVERGHKYCLEGFLFPDTYKFYIGGSPEHALEKMLSGFNKRFDEDLYAQLAPLNEQLTQQMKKNGKSEEYIAEHQLSLRDLLTVASLIEKETANAQESYTIASVIYNRLYNWGSTPPYLNIDATIIYALDGKSDLTAEDLKVDSPYNTYTHMGLCPGPIANPGLSSIQAALKPENTGYYFYVLNPQTNRHQFSKTLEDHEKFVAEFAEMRKQKENEGE